MQTTYLQSLIATNASKIASKHAMHAFFVDKARANRLKGEISYMVDDFSKAAKYRAQLARLHTIQKALYAELKANYRRDRIEAKGLKLWGLVGVVTPSDMTGHEFETYLDERLAAKFAQKAA